MNFPPFLYLSPSSQQILRQGHYNVDKFFVNQLSYCCFSGTQRDKERKKIFERAGGFLLFFSNGNDSQKSVDR